eukprot:scaffold6263_cov63-Cylindrotheca_fusiformis.AAC.1
MTWSSPIHPIRHKTQTRCLPQANEDLASLRERFYIVFRKVVVLPIAELIYLNDCQTNIPNPCIRMHGRQKRKTRQKRKSHSFERTSRTSQFCPNAEGRTSSINRTILPGEQ